MTRLPRKESSETVKKDRSHWIGGVARSHEEMEAIDQAWWLSLSREARLQLVMELSQAADWSEYGNEQGSTETSCPDSARGLRGAVGGVRKLRG